MDDAFLFKDGEKVSSYSVTGALEMKDGPFCWTQCISVLCHSQEEGIHSIVPDLQKWQSNQTYCNRRFEVSIQTMVWCGIPTSQKCGHDWFCFRFTWLCVSRSMRFRGFYWRLFSDVFSAELTQISDYGLVCWLGVYRLGFSTLCTGISCIVSTYMLCTNIVAAEEQEKCIIHSPR